MIRIEKDDKYGWTITTPTDELLEYIMEKGWEDIDMGRGCLFGLFRGKDTPESREKALRREQEVRYSPKRGIVADTNAPAAKLS